MSGFTIDGVAVSGLESLKDPDGEPITASGVEKLEESVRRRLERGFIRVDSSPIDS